MRKFFNHFCFINMCWCAFLLYGFTAGKLTFQRQEENPFDALYATAAKPVHISKR